MTRTDNNSYNVPRIWYLAIALATAAGTLIAFTEGAAAGFLR